MVWLSAAEQKNANNHTAIRKVGRRRGDCMAGVLSPKLRDVLRPDLRVSVTGLSKTTTHRRVFAPVFPRRINRRGRMKTHSCINPIRVHIFPTIAVHPGADGR